MARDKEKVAEMMRQKQAAGELGTIPLQTPSNTFLHGLLTRPLLETSRRQEEGDGQVNQCRATGRATTIPMATPISVRGRI